MDREDAAADPHERIRELEEELAKERGRSRFLDALQSSVQLGVTAVDPSGRQLFVNQAFAEMVGWEPEELIGRSPPFVYWAPEVAERIRVSLAEIIGTGQKRWSADWVFQRRSGERFDVAIHTAPLLDSDGGQLGWVAAMIDISERERLRRHLTRAVAERRTLQAAVEASGEAIFLTDPNGIFTYVNRRFTEIYGWTQEDVVGKATPRILKSGELAPEVYESFWQALLSGQIVRGRIVNRTRDGRPVHMESSANAILSESGGIAGFLAIQSDMTERHELSEQLLQAQKMEAVGRLAGGVAHDFNNLLAVILNYAGFALDALPAGDTIREDIEEIHRAGERAAALTRQLLLLSRREASRAEILDIGQVLASTEKILRRTIGEDVDLLVEIEDDLAPVKADLGNLTQILMNLAVNARDAMPHGGRLEIRNRQESVVGAAARELGIPDGTYVALEVTDSGSGMTKEVLARAFEPFFTTKPAGKGTGLGLPIVHRVVHDLGGTVTIASEPGKGTTFTLLLPASVERPRPKSERPGAPMGAGRTVLVLEDDAAVRTMTRRILSRSGFAVLEAANAGEALLRCEGHPGEIDLLLSDVVLPQLSGPGIAGRLRALRPRMAVLFMSGYPESLRPEDLDAMGAAFLPKPFSRDQLLAKISDIKLA